MELTTPTWKTEYLQIKKQLPLGNVANFADLHSIVFTGPGYLMIKLRLKKIEKNASYILKEGEHIQIQLLYLGCGIVGFG